MQLANSCTLTQRNLNTIRFYNLKIWNRQYIIVTRSGRQYMIIIGTEYKTKVVIFLLLNLKTSKIIAEQQNTVYTI
jgi:hypothetical protein